MGAINNAAAYLKGLATVIVDGVASGGHGVIDFAGNLIKAVMGG